MNILCSAALSPRAGGIKISAGLKEADKIGTPEAVNDALNPDLWRSAEDVTCCSMYKSKATLSRGLFHGGSNEEAW